MAISQCLLDEIDSVWPSSLLTMAWVDFLSNVVRPSCKTEALIPYMCNSLYYNHLKTTLDVEIDGIVHRTKFIKFIEMFPSGSLNKTFLDFLSLVSRPGYLGRCSMDESKSILLEAFSETLLTSEIRALYTVRMSNTVSGVFTIDFLLVDTGTIAHVRNTTYKDFAQEPILELMHRFELAGYVMVGPA